MLQHHGHVKAVRTAMRRLGFETLIDGKASRSFRGLLAHLAAIVRNTMRRADATPGEGTFTLTTRPNPKQRQALALAAAVAV